METVQVQIRQRGELPTNILVSSPRLDDLRQRMVQPEREIRELEKQISSLTTELQRLDQGTYSLETSQRRAAVKRDLGSLERRLLEHQSQRNRIQDEHRQWAEQIAMKQFTRRLLWRELPEAHPGPADHTTFTRMYDIGEKEQRTTGDVKRDLIDTITWLLNFGGPDAELARELQQLRQQPMGEQRHE